MHWFVMGVPLICHENPPKGGLTAVVIVTVTAQIHQGCASRASGDTAGLANIGPIVTAYFSSLILARPYIPLSWLWRVCRLSSSPYILQEFLSKVDQLSVGCCYLDAPSYLSLDDAPPHPQQDDVPSYPRDFEGRIALAWQMRPEM